MGLLGRFFGVGLVLNLRSRCKVFLLPTAWFSFGDLSLAGVRVFATINDILNM